jgi:hypothetical protein
LEVTAFRLAGWDTPLWVNPNRFDHRFNRAGDGPTQYLSLHPLTAWAELLRRENRRTEAEIDELRARLWVLRLLLPHLPTVTFDSAHEYGIDPGALVADDYGACQDLADRCRGDPDLPMVIRVPSAALPGTANVVIFAPRVAAPYLAIPVSDVDVPASVGAEKAQALHTLPALVRYRGQPHAEFDAWRRGQPFTFEEPPTPMP